LVRMMKSLHAILACRQRAIDGCGDPSVLSRGGTIV
jgi:hypothetical protein